MSNIPPNETGKDSSELSPELKEYLESANDAANRTRYVSIVLVIATILIFVGLNNEYMNSWMVEDLREIYRPDDRSMSSLFRHKILYDLDDALYFKNQCIDSNEIEESINIPNLSTNKLLKTDPHAVDLKCQPPIEKAKEHAQIALMRTHMESRLFIKIPILGVAIHVNDLGLIGGITLIVLLLLVRTCLSREIKNLNFSFKKACEAKQLDKFYDTLAMRQLFTVPNMKGERRNLFLSKTPYIVCIFPAFVYLCLVIYDVFTAIIIPRYNPFAKTSILWLMIVETICGFIILFTASRCLERHHYIYSIWDDYWKLLKPEDELCLIEPEVKGKLIEGKDYFFITDENQAKKVGLSPDIVSKLIEAKGSINQSGNLYLVRRLWRAIKEETTPIIHFFWHLLRRLFKRKVKTPKPLLITVSKELADEFDNDKEINDMLREILKQRKKPTDNSGRPPSTSEKAIKDDK